MKSCGRCSAEKPLTEFSPLKSGRGGRNPVCRPCRAELARVDRLQNGEKARRSERERYAANPTPKRLSMARWGAANVERHRQRAREHYAANREALLSGKAAYRARNRARIYEWNGTRRAAIRRALPRWADRRVIAAIYAEAMRQTAATGVSHHVDHDIPLCHPLVCGLHVPANLVIVTGAENMAKGNRWHPETYDGRTRQSAP